jgi:hypothetical protein
MSGWHPSDKMQEEDTGDDFPAINNITVAGYLPSDQVPAPSKLPPKLTVNITAKSRSVVEAHFKSLRLFRKYCRYMPFVIGW